MRFEIWIGGRCVRNFSRPWNPESTPPYTGLQRDALEVETRWALKLYPIANAATLYRLAPDRRHVLTIERET